MVTGIQPLPPENTPSLPEHGHIYYPASLAQRRLWFLDRLGGSTSAYNIHVGLWLYGPVDLPALHASLHEIVRRHESLRTTFRLVRNELIQVVAEDQTVALPVTSFSEEPEPLPRVYEHARRVVAAPFDLSTGPLFRAEVFRIAPEESVLLCVMHHIITDAWSMQLFTKEMAVLYEAFSNGKSSSLPDLPIQYGDYSEWQHASFQTEDVQKHISFWKQTLQGSPPVLHLPQDKPRPAEQTLQGATSTFPVPPEIVAQVKTIAAQQQVTPFMLLLAAFKVLLYRYSGQTDMLVGIPVAGRSHLETEELIGFFVNTLALRDNLCGNPRFSDLLVQVRENMLAAFAHAEVPFEKVVEILRPERNLSYNPVFQVMFSAIKSPVESRDFGNLKLFPYVVDASTSMFDLSMTLVEWMDGRWFTQIDYNTDLFESATIARMQQHFHNLLGAVTADPHKRIADLPLLSTDEEHQFLVDFNSTQANFRHDVCLHHFFEEQVRRTPHRIALICGDEPVSYNQLNCQADGLATYLRRQGVGPDVLVGICADRGIDLLIGILGILKAGGAYVPLDPAYPQERLAFIVEDSHLKLIVTQKKFRDNFSGSPVTCIDLDGRWPMAGVDPTRQANPTPENLAYVLFTSGSTGRPKGVALEHQNAANLIQWAQTVFTPQELSGTLFSTSICFDLSIFELFVPWSVGGAVIVAPNAVSLTDLPAGKKVTLINTVPSIMAELVRAGAIPDSVLTVNLAGEPLPSSLVRDLYSQTKVRNVYNLYGPTEAATYATCARVSRDADVTIGKPIANTQAYILDRDSKLVPRGGQGELYLGGEGLARGYFGRPDLTAERFVHNPFSSEAGARLYRTGDLCRHRPDGNIEYLGRLDHQVKLRGFRIELGEIESVLERHESVRQAITVVLENAGEKRIAAYVAAKPGHAIVVSQLHQHAEKTLPTYMVPAAFVVIEDFPLTPNGKVDRRALPVPERQARTTAIAPRNEMEARLRDIWEAILHVDPIGVTDNFFDLGGHSLLAARLMAELQNLTDEKIPLSAIFRAPTIESLALLLASDLVSKPDPVIMKLHHGNGGVPFFAIAAPGVDSLGFALLARHLGEQQSIYKLQGPGPLVRDRPFEVEELRAIAGEYVRAMRTVRPHGPYSLGGMCDGVQIAQQMILDLESQGEEVGLFAIFDTWVLENSQIWPLWAVNYYLSRLRTFPKLTLKEQVATVKRVLRRVMGDEQSSEQTGWVKAYWPGNDFRPPYFRAPILLFKRPRQPFFYVRDPLMGWGARSAEGVEVCEIKCGHFEMLRPPHVEIIGQTLARRMSGMDQRGQKPGTATHSMPKQLGTVPIG
jgi:amino acid adenylation domain-containing protein